MSLGESESCLRSDSASIRHRASIVNIESFRSQRSEFKYPEAFSQLSSLCVTDVDLLYSHYAQVIEGVVRLIEVSGHWFLQLLGGDVELYILISQSSDREADC